MQPVESSQIAAIGHDAETNTLAVRFKNWKGVPTSLYHYRNFNAEHFGAHIKPFAEKYRYTKIEDAAPAAAA